MPGTISSMSNSFPVGLESTHDLLPLCKSGILALSVYLRMRATTKVGPIGRRNGRRGAVLLRPLEEIETFPPRVVHRSGRVPAFPTSSAATTPKPRTRVLRRLEHPDATNWDNLATRPTMWNGLNEGEYWQRTLEAGDYEGLYQGYGYH